MDDRDDLTREQQLDANILRAMRCMAAVFTQGCGRSIYKKRVKKNLTYQSGFCLILKLIYKSGGNKMALIQCPECQKEVSDSAASCPHCGFALKNSENSVEVKKKQSSGCFTAIVVAFVILVVFGFISYACEDKKPSKPAAPVDPISKCFSPWDGSCRPLERIVKDGMKDPSSYEHVATNYYATKDKNIKTVEMQFRGKNSFGALIVQTVKGKLYVPDCSITSIEE